MEGAVAIDFLSGGFAEVSDDELSPCDYLLIFVTVILFLWGLIRLIQYQCLALHYTSFNDEPSSNYVNLKGTNTEEMDEENGKELDEVSNVALEKSGVELQAGKYIGNTYVQMDVEGRAGGLPAMSESSTTSEIKGALDYRFKSTHTTVKDIIFFGFYIILNIIAYFICGPYPSADDAGKNLGSLVAANSVITVLFATRHSLLVYLVGIPFDVAIQFHRWLGRWTGILLALHFIIENVNFVATANDQALTDNTTDIPATVTSMWIDNESPVANRWGLAGGIVYIFIFIFSLEFFRRNYFEVFLVSHLLIIAFFTFGALHVLEDNYFAIVAACLFGIDVLVRILLSNVILPRKTTVFKKRSDGLTQVRFAKDMPSAKMFYRPGQYVFVNFPSISLGQWHPFSVSSAPDDPEIEINIRALGNFTKEVAALASQTTQTWIRFDGPFGNLNLDYHRYKNMVLVAGGIGITPVLGILREVFTSERRRRSRLERVTMLWSVPSAGEGEWFIEDFRAIMKRAASSGVHLDLRIQVTRAEKGAPPPDPPFYNGRPNMNQILEDSTNHRSPCFVFVCGPRKMVNSTWDIATALQRNGLICHFHHETFEF